MKDFEEGGALVAGGSGGLGAAICQALIDAGTSVAVGYRSNRDMADAVASRDKSGRSFALHLDLMADGAAANAVREAADRFGQLHSVVYASGPPLQYLYIAEIDSCEWERVMHDDVNACFRLIEACLPKLREQRSGSVLAVTTAAVDHAPPRDILSAAPKAAIEMLVKGVAREEGRNGVRANCVRPGLIAAGLGLSTMNDHTQDYVDRMTRAVPLRRAGSAEEIAQAALFLLFRRASYISGACVPVAGGLQLV